MNNSLINFKKALLDFDTQLAENVILEEINEDNKIRIINYFIVNSLTDFGTKWENDELSLSQIYMTSRICEEIVTKLFPENITIEDNSIAIATLSDYHLLGKKIVLSVLRTSGCNIIDYGHGLSPKDLVDKVIKDKIKILLISSLMLPSALLIKDVKTKFTKAKYKVKILVGGAPFIFDKLLYKKVGADAMGSSPHEAIDVLKKWKLSLNL